MGNSVLSSRLHPGKPKFQTKGHTHEHPTYHFLASLQLLHDIDFDISTADAWFRYVAGKERPRRMLRLNPHYLPVPWNPARLVLLLYVGADRRAAILCISWR